MLYFVSAMGKLTANIAELSPSGYKVNLTIPLIAIN